MKFLRWKVRWKLFASWLSERVDFDDVLYVIGVVACSAGAWQFHPGAGLLCGGVMIALSPLLSMIRGSGSPKGKP